MPMSNKEREAARRDLRAALPELAEWFDSVNAVFTPVKLRHGFDVRGGNNIEIGRPGIGASPMMAPPPPEPRPGPALSTDTAYDRALRLLEQAERSARRRAA